MFGTVFINEFHMCLTNWIKAMYLRHNLCFCYIALFYYLLHQAFDYTLHKVLPKIYYSNHCTKMLFTTLRQFYSLPRKASFVCSYDSSFTMRTDFETFSKHPSLSEAMLYYKGAPFPKFCCLSCSGE